MNREIITFSLSFWIIKLEKVKPVWEEGVALVEGSASKMLKPDTVVDRWITPWLWAFTVPMFKCKVPFSFYVVTLITCSKLGLI